MSAELPWLTTPRRSPVLAKASLLLMLMVTSPGHLNQIAQQIGNPRLCLRRLIATVPVARNKEVSHVSPASIASTFGSDPLPDRPGGRASHWSCGGRQLQPRAESSLSETIATGAPSTRCVATAVGVSRSPLPPLPQPTAEHQYREPLILDVTTQWSLNPLTVVYHVAHSFA